MIIDYLCKTLIFRNSTRIIDYPVQNLFFKKYTEIIDYPWQLEHDVLVFNLIFENPI